jgi:hypothetical protein
MSKRLKRGKSIYNQQERTLGSGHGLTDDRSRGAMRQNVVDESVAIEPFAFDGKVKITGRNGTRVNRPTADDGFGGCAGEEARSGGRLDLR